MSGSREDERVLDRGRILELFDELSAELRFSRTRGQIYILGGAAMSLAFSADRRTEDVDARIDTGHSRLVEAVRKIGRKHGLTDTWLNDQATTAIPRTADVRAAVVYESPYLTVTGASARHLLAMKLLAAREKDRDDIAALVEHLRAEGAEGRDPDLQGPLPEREGEVQRPGNCSTGRSRAGHWSTTGRTLEGARTGL